MSLRCSDLKLVAHGLVRTGLILVGIFDMFPVEHNLYRQFDSVLRLSIDFDPLFEHFTPQIWNFTLFGIWRVFPELELLTFTSIGHCDDGYKRHIEEMTRRYFDDKLELVIQEKVSACFAANNEI